MGIGFSWTAEIGAGLAGLLEAEQPGVAVFDADGTLWATDVVESFLADCGDRLPARQTPAWEATLERVVNEISLETAHLQLELFSGLDLATARTWAEEVYRSRIQAAIYEPIAELVRRLGERGTEVWVCSGSPEWLVVPCVASLGIPADRVIATQAVVSDGKLTQTPIAVTAGSGKSAAISRRIDRPLAFAAGDSMSDYDMLCMAARALVIQPLDDDGRRGELVTRARSLGWWVQPVSSPIGAGLPS